MATEHTNENSRQGRENSGVYSALEEEIIRLRREGKWNREIATLLELPYSTICQTAAWLVQQGKLPDGRGCPGPDHQKAYTKATASALQADIIRLREAGKSNGAIATILELPYSNICQITARLVQQGKLPDGRGRARKDDRRRWAVIVRMIRRGATGQQIGQRLGLSRERVRQLLLAIEEDQGPVICPLLSTQDIATPLGVSVQAINRLRCQGHIRPAGERLFSFLYRPTVLDQIPKLLQAQEAAKAEAELTGPPSLAKMIVRVLEESSQPLRAKVIADRVLQAGYTTTSKNFANVIYKKLHRLKKQKPIVHLAGGYRLQRK